MNKTWQKVLAVVMAMIAGSVMAGAIHTWSSGETLTSSDLNSNFQHIHNLMVGGHGARLVDADVSASANIAGSKIAPGANIPAFYGKVLNVCGSGTCTLNNPQHVTSVTWSATGDYIITLDHTPNSTPTVVVGSIGSTGTFCAASAVATNTFHVYCFTATTVAANSGFSFIGMEKT